MIKVFILARAKSKRLPGKHFLDLGGMPIVEFMVRRCEHFGFTPHLCVPDGEERVFATHTSCLDIYEGHPTNIETRLIEASHHFGVSVFHALDGDDPFFSRELVLSSVQLFLRAGKVSRILPCIASQCGSGLVGTSFNRDAPKDSTVEVLPDPADAIYPQRLTLDYQEDYELLKALVRMGCDYMSPRSYVDSLFIRNPDLYRINWFRTEAWKEKQRHESITASRNSSRTLSTLGMEEEGSDPQGDGLAQIEAATLRESQEENR